ncbi:HAD family hydrolase [Streptomyces sp. NPDC091212]|uniref:HAD family hydrolase n=1 Tax=Streptomyces sp. NPDC091212 TaxID=3155191 RepID=UPI00343BD294
MRLALFDLDNTLVDRTEAITRWAQEFAAAKSLGPAAVDWLIKTDDDGLLPKPDFFAQARAHFGLLESAAELQLRYERRYPSHMRCPTAVLDGLTALRTAGWRLGVVTNGLTTVQQAVLDHTGLTAHLDGWCISETESIRKPDPEIFHRTATRCGTDLTDAWMIGDSPEADIVGGQNAGVPTIWISRTRSWPGDHPVPDHTTADIGEAITLLLAFPQD